MGKDTLSSARAIAPASSFEELAAQQHVAPIDDFDALLGKPYQEDESMEEFAAALGEWRREGSAGIPR